jgi:hypothetical protein
MSSSNGFIHAQSFNEALNTGISFHSFDTLKEAREKSVKQVSIKTYDRYKENHIEYKQFTFVDKVTAYILDKIEQLIFGDKYK